MFNNLRPGVYARYDLSGASYHGGGKAAALILNRGVGDPAGLHIIKHPQDIPSASCGLARDCLKLLFDGGVGKIYLLYREENSDAFGELQPAGEIRAVVCGEDIPAAGLTAYLDGRSAAQRECLAFIGADAPQSAVTAAEKLSHGRVCVCATAVSISGGEGPSGIYGACCLAAAVLSNENPLRCFSGMDFPTLQSAPQLPETEVQSLLAAGVCVFEEIGGSVRLIRAMTVSPDKTLRGLNTVLIIDYVMDRLRGCLHRRVSAGVVNPQSIRDQVTAELAAITDEGVLADFAPPNCYSSKEDPALCIVELAFSAAHLISRIHITARITTN